MLVAGQQKKRILLRPNVITEKGHCPNIFQVKHDMVVLDPIEITRFPLQENPGMPRFTIHATIIKVPFEEKPGRNVVVRQAVHGGY